MIVFPYRLLALRDGELIGDDLGCEMVRAHIEHRDQDNHQVVTGLAMPELMVEQSDYLFLHDDMLYRGKQVRLMDGNGDDNVGRIMHRARHAEMAFLRREPLKSSIETHYAMGLMLTGHTRSFSDEFLVALDEILSMVRYQELSYYRGWVEDMERFGNRHRLALAAQLYKLPEIVTK